MKVKLSNDQVEHIENYLKHHEIRYWDVRFELLDHIICDVERFMEDGLEFEIALEEVHKSFGNKVLFYAWEKGENSSGKSIYHDNSGYKKLVEQKRLVIHKKIRRNFRETIRNVLINIKWALIFGITGTIFLFIALYLPMKYVMLTSVVAIIAPCLVIWANQLYHRKRTSLALVVYSGFVGITINIPNLINVIRLINEEYLKTDLFKITYTTICLIAAFISWSLLLGYLKMKKQYEEWYKEAVSI